MAAGGGEPRPARLPGVGGGRASGGKSAFVIAEPGGYLIAPQGEERIGDVSNVVFTNGWVARKNGQLFIYYASSDTRCHVAETTVDLMLDYVLNTPPEAGRSYACVQQRHKLISKNLPIMKAMGIKS